jgi:hypothetical protein
MRTFQVYFFIHTPININLSLVKPGHEAGVLSLIELTCDVVQEKLKGIPWALGAFLQRAILPLIIDSCIE